MDKDEADSMDTDENNCVRVSWEKDDDNNVTTLANAPLYFQSLQPPSPKGTAALSRSALASPRKASSNLAPYFVVRVGEANTEYLMRRTGEVLVAQMESQKDIGTEKENMNDDDRKGVNAMVPNDLKVDDAKANARDESIEANVTQSSKVDSLDSSEEAEVNALLARAKLHMLVAIVC